MENVKHTVDTPRPGLYRGVPQEVYHAWGAISNSALSHLKRSPRHLRQHLDTPVEPTPAMLLGSATHTAILEPDQFDARYMRAPDVDRRTKEGKALIDSIYAAYPGVALLKPDEYDRCIGMRDAVHGCETASNLLHGTGDVELSFVWEHENGVLRKGRADRVSWEIAGGTIVDLKTTKDARRSAFERTIFAMGYYNQGAGYVDGIRAQSLAIKHYTIIAVESEAPYGVCVYRMRDEVIEAGRIENAALLEKYAACLAANEWPGYSDEIMDIGLPVWAWDNIERGME
jgi:exodeoxyribonuclease VIII